VDKNTSVYFGSYNTKSKRGNQFTLEQFDGLKLKSKLMADVVSYQADSARWQVQQWHERQFVDGKERLTKGKSKSIDLKLLPEHVVSLVKQAHLLDFQQITEKIELDRKRGSDSVQFYEVELHQRNAAAFSNIILTIIAVSLASKKTRGGLGINLSIGLALVMFYLLINKFGVTFAQYSDLNPVIAAWLPNIFYGVVAIILFRKAQK
ncbi:MAG: LptF/LptG family permease, partial [Flavobacteriales bacterium]